MTWNLVSCSTLTNLDTYERFVWSPHWGLSEGQAQWLIHSFSMELCTQAPRSSLCSQGSEDRFFMSVASWRAQSFLSNFYKIFGIVSYETTLWANRKLDQIRHGGKVPSHGSSWVFESVGMEVSSGDYSEPLYAFQNGVQGLLYLSEYAQVKEWYLIETM